MLQRAVPRPGIPEPEDFTPRPWADADDTALAEHFNSKGFKRAGNDLIRNVVTLEAHGHAYHPVPATISLCSWSWTARRASPASCSTTAGPAPKARPDEERRGAHSIHRSGHPLVLRLRRRPRLQAGMQVRLHARVRGRHRASSSPAMLRILAVRHDGSPTRCRKTFHRKDARHHLAGRWIIEMAEIAQFKRGEVESNQELPLVPDRHLSAALRTLRRQRAAAMRLRRQHQRRHLHARHPPATAASGRSGSPPSASTTIPPTSSTSFGPRPSAPSTKLAPHGGSPTRSRTTAAEVQHERLTPRPVVGPARRDRHPLPARRPHHRRSLLPQTRTEAADRTRADEMRIGNILRDLGLVRTRRQVRGERKYVYVRAAAGGADPLK